jgi:hypothetical protein
MDDQHRRRVAGPDQFSRAFGSSWPATPCSACSELDERACAADFALYEATCTHPVTGTRVRPFDVGVLRLDATMADVRLIRHIGTHSD